MKLPTEEMERMSIMKTSSRSHDTVVRVVYFGALALWGMLFYALNVLTTLKGDDITYLYYESAGELFRVGSLSDYFRSLVYHYSTTNGRLADVLARFFCSMTGKAVFDVVNAVMGMAFVDLLTRMISGRRRVLPLLLTLLFVLAIIPIPGETMLWLAGATNYMWAAMFTLWLLRYLSACATKASGTVALPLLFLGSFIAGGMCEVVAFPGLAALTAWLALNWCKRRGAAFAAWLGYALGVVLLVSSPGFSERFAHDLGGGDASLLSSIFGNLFTVARRSARMMVIAAALMVLIARYGVLLWNQWRGKSDSVDATKVLPQLMFWASMGVLLVLGEAKKDRVYFVTSVMAWVVMMPYVVAWVDARNPKRALKVAVAIGLATLCVWSASRAVSAVWRYKQHNDKVERAISAAPDLCALPTYEFAPNRWVAVSYYDNERYNSYHRYYCDYYGKRQVAFLRPSMLERYQSPEDMLAGGEPVALRCETDTAARIYRFEGESYSLLPVEASLVDPVGIFLDFNLRPGDNRLTRGTAGKYAYQGNLHERNQLSYYTLTKGDRTYFVLPAVDDDVVEVSIPIRNGKALHFKRVE